MTDSAKITDGTHGELTPRMMAPCADATASGAVQDVATCRATHLERAHRLGQQLRVQVTIDDTGWLRRDVELVFTKSRDGTLWPVKVRVGCEATDEDVLARGGVVARCAQYNAAIRTLRELAARLAQLVHHGQISLAPRSPVAYAHRELSRLDALVARRQSIVMGHGVVRIATLAREIEFFERSEAHFAPIVLAAEHVARTVEPCSRSPPQQTRSWLRWLTSGFKGARHEEPSPRSAE